jgi:LacI family transcriptional regulator
LPPHCGVFVVLDLFARMFLRAARELGRAVPDDLAILGAGDDPFLTALEPVPLSSLRFPSGDIGYRAAALMDELLSRPARAPKRRELLLPCCELIPRQSTDAIVFADQAVSKAKHFIRDHPGCNVAEVLQAVGVSRSGLQERFRRSVGRTILEDIHHNRLNRAIALLQTTDHSMETIAEMVGFGSAQRLFSLFRAKIGSTPGEVRSAARAMKS